MQLRSYTFVSHGRELTFRGPALLADLEKTVGQNAAIEAYFTAYGYDRNRDVYAKVVEKAEAATGEKRLHHTTKSKRDETKHITVYDETEKKFMERITAMKDSTKHGFVVTEEVWTQWLREANEEIGDWQYKPGSDRKPAEKFYTLADEILLRIENKTDNGKGAASEEGYRRGIENKLGVDFQSVFGDWNRDNLARALKAVDEANQRKMAEQLDAGLEE